MTTNRTTRHTATKVDGTAKKEDATPTKTTPRKVPHCTKCNRPRAGHPRSGCPYTTSSVPVVSKHAGKVDEEGLVDAVQALRIRPELVDDQVERRRRRSSVKPTIVPAPTLESLDTTSSEIARGLLKPGAFDDVGIDVDDIQLKVGRWLGNTPAKSRRDTAAALESCNLTEPNPLVPPADVGEMQKFLDSLAAAGTSTSPLTYVFTIEADKVPTAKAAAEGVGFHARAILPTAKSADTGACLILARDSKSADELVNKVKAEWGNSERGGARVIHAAGGAVAGALALWTGLAFS